MRKITSNDWENKLNLSLKKNIIDLVEFSCKNWKIDPVIWREEEIRRTIQILNLAEQKQSCFSLRALSLKNCYCRMNC